MKSGDPAVLVCVPRAFDGVPHERCLDIWVREARAQGFSFASLENRIKKRNHEGCFSEIWNSCKDSDEYDILVITEMDVIPSHDFLVQIVAHHENHDFLGVEYATREPGTLTISRSGTTGGWFVSINLHRHRGELDFGGHTDPGQTLRDQLPGIHIFPGEDSSSGLGLTYPFGCHLFWSRAICDPRQVAPGFIHEDIVDHWDQELANKKAELQIRGV